MQSFTYFDLSPNFDPSDPIWDEIGVKITGASLSLDSVHVGYTRIEDGGSGFLLVPSVVYSGRAEITGTKPGTSEPVDLLKYYLFDNTPCGPFLALDLRDGTRLY